MVELINTIITFLLEFIEPLTEAFKSVWENITTYPFDTLIPDQNLKAFLGATINTFIPIGSIITAVTMVIPFKLANFVMACVIRVKGFLTV